METNQPIEVSVDGHKLMAVGRYYDGINKWASHKIKEGDPEVIDFVARKMAVLVPKNSILIPVPNHCGYARESLLLTESVSKYSEMPLCDILKGNMRESIYQVKHNGGMLSEDEIGFHKISGVPPDKTPVIIDGVIDTGRTALSALHAIGSGMVVSFSISDTLLDNKMEQTPQMKR